jgi:hypothetical protein
MASGGGLAMDSFRPFLPGSGGGGGGEETQYRFPPMVGSEWYPSLYSAYPTAANHHGSGALPPKLTPSPHLGLPPSNGLY